MCEFCSKHGKGNRWYLNPENFSDEMMKDPQRVKTLEKLAGWGIEYYIDFTSRVTRLVNWPVLGKAAKAIVNRIAPNKHGGQVVSLEDSLQLLEYTKDFVLLPCECRKLVGYRDDMVCLRGMPAGMQTGSHYGRLAGEREKDRLMSIKVREIYLHIRMQNLYIVRAGNVLGTQTTAGRIV
jgi:hypothetical protein